MGIGKEFYKKIPMSDYISIFIQHKTAYDIRQFQKIMKIQLENATLTTKELREKCGFSNNMARLFISYLQQLNGNKRNEDFQNVFQKIFS